VLIQQLAEALDEAHGYDLVHGHLRPSNIFIEENGPRARISAFRFSNTIEQQQRLGGNYLINREALCYT
jgi:serine/threonine protein kinase